MPEGRDFGFFICLFRVAPLVAYLLSQLGYTLCILCLFMCSSADKLFVPMDITSDQGQLNMQTSTDAAAATLSTAFSSSQSTATFFDRPRAAHSIVKASILKRYLHAWFAILGQAKTQHHDDLVIVDGCAGTGTYPTPTGGTQPGSPLIAINCYREIRDKLKGKDKTPHVHFVFVENHKKRFQKLNAVLEEYREDPLYCAICRIAREGCGFSIMLLNKTFENAFPAFRHLIADRYKKVFAFLDPFGYSSVPMDIIEKLMGRGRELFINFMGGYAVRYD